MTASRWQEIREALLARIVGGVWAPGGAIPSEAELAEEFGVTRPTVSRALRDLVAGGLIERKRRAGSRVALRRTAEATLRIPIVREEVEARGGRYGFILLSRGLTAPPAPVGAAFALAPGAPALHLRTLHCENDRPHQLEDRWINLRAVPEAQAQDFAAISANEWLVRQAPFTGAEHVLRAAGAAAEEAAQLQIPPGAPVFVIERTTWCGDDAVTQARLTHPAERFRIVTRDHL